MKSLRLIFTLWIVFFSSLELSFAQEKSKNNPEINLIQSLLSKSDYFINTNLDSALYYAKKADLLVDEIKEKHNKVELYMSLGDIYLGRSNYEQSLEYFIKAVQLIDQQLSVEPMNNVFVENKISVQNKLGNLYAQQKNYNKAQEHYNKALFTLEKASFITVEKSRRYKVKIYNNLAGLLTREKKYKEALAFLNSAREINSLLKDNMNDAFFFNNAGICYLELKDFSLAIYYFDQALKLWEKQNNLRGIMQCYNNLGEANLRSEKYVEAEVFFNKALALSIKSGYADSKLISLEGLNVLYEKTHKLTEAYTKFKDLTKLKDSLYNVQTAKQMVQLEMNYKLDQQKKIYEINLKNKEDQQQQTNLIYIAIGTALLFLLLILGLLIYLQKTKIKNYQLNKEKLELEHQNINLEKQKLKEEVEFQNREITSKMLYLMKKNEMLQFVGKQLLELKKGLASQYQKKIQDIIIEMRLQNDQDYWGDFEMYFMKVHPDFYTKLQDLFPNLTPNEKKLCAFLRLNMSTKDICAITYQSVNSVMVSRYRLRKKLNIQGDEQNLVNFLMKL